MIDRTDILEKKIDVMVAEFNEVLDELQTALNGMMRMHEVYVRVTNARMDGMESLLKQGKDGGSESAAFLVVSRDPSTPGKEL